MVPQRSLDIRDIELEPTLEELDVPVGAVQRGPSRAVAIAIGLFGAIVGWGFVGGSASPATTNLAPAALSSPAATGQPVPVAAITTPIAGEAVGARVLVTGTATVPGDRVLVRITLGELVLGAADVKVEAGFFAATVPVVAPTGGGALPVDVRVVAPDSPGVVITQSRARLAPRPAVSIDTITRASQDGTAVITVRGSAPLLTGRLTVMIASRSGRERTVVVVGPVRDPQLADAARLFGVGSWTATVPVQGDPGTVRAIVRWDDGTSAGGTVALDEAGR
jgi:hypothetical protein